MSGQSPDSADEPGRADGHLTEVEDGCGCAEVWEHLSERREADRRAASSRASEDPASRDGGE
jgi:hypothetical protein